MAHSAWSTQEDYYILHGSRSHQVFSWWLLWPFKVEVQKTWCFYFGAAWSCCWQQRFLLCRPACQLWCCLAELGHLPSAALPQNCRSEQSPPLHVWCNKARIGDCEGSRWCSSPQSLPLKDQQRGHKWSGIARNHPCWRANRWAAEMPAQGHQASCASWVLGCSVSCTCRRLIFLGSYVDRFLGAISVCLSPSLLLSEKAWLTFFLIALYLSFSASLLTKHDNDGLYVQISSSYSFKCPDVFVVVVYGYGNDSCSVTCVSLNRYNSHF